MTTIDQAIGVMRDALELARQRDTAEAKVAELEATLAERDREVAQLREALANANRVAQSAIADRDDRDRRIADLESRFHLKEQLRCEQLRQKSKALSAVRDKLHAAQQSIARLEEALRFYADRTNWCGHTYSHGGTWAEIGVPCRDDRGQRARQALDKEEP